jgi:hypothetical protein
MTFDFKRVGCSKYEHENCLFTRYSSRNGVIYAKCSNCDSTCVIRNGAFTLLKPHTCFDTGDIDLESSSNETDNHVEHYETDIRDDIYDDSDVVLTHERNYNRKMCLIDRQSLDKLKNDNWKKPVEQMLDALKRKEDNSWKKPIEKRTKTKLSLQMKRILESDDDDDVKVKQYQQTLSCFLKLKKKLATEEAVAETVAETVKEEVKSKPIKQPKRQPSPEPVRKSARGKKQKFTWDEY